MFQEERRASAKVLRLRNSKEVDVAGMEKDRGREAGAKVK